MTMTKTERNELRSIVKTQFKVLRAEIVQRQAELLSDLEGEIAARYSAEDERRKVVHDQVAEILGVAQREITDVLASEDVGVSVHRPYQVRGATIDWPKDDRGELRRQAMAAFHAKVAAATLRLDREEADLLRTLAVGALETDEAQAFLAMIPTVGELVPVARLEALIAGGEMPEATA